MLFYMSADSFVSVGHECEIINMPPGAEEERLWLQSNCDAVQTVKFMDWILLKAGGVINSAAKKKMEEPLRLPDE